MNPTRNNLFTLSLTECLSLLKAGRIKYISPSGERITVQQRGPVKTWKRLPGEYEIPVKMGKQIHDRLTDGTWFDRDEAPYVPESDDPWTLPDQLYRISAE